MAGVAAAGSITYQTVETDHAGDKLRLYVIGYELTRPGGPPQIAEGRGLPAAITKWSPTRAGLILGESIRLGRQCSRSSD